MTPKDADREERLAFVEQLLARQLRARSIVRACVRKFEVSIRTVYTDIAKVREQWEEDSRKLDREAKRLEVEATVREAISLAFARKQVVRNGDGSVVVQKNGRPLTRDDPDVRTVIRGASVLADVLGLKSWRLETQVQSQVEQLLESVQPHMTTEAYESLVRALEVVMGVAEMAESEEGGGPAPIQH